jgi:hypothetical protein
VVLWLRQGAKQRRGRPTMLLDQTPHRGRLPIGEVTVADKFCRRRLGFELKKGSPGSLYRVITWPRCVVQGLKAPSISMFALESSLIRIRFGSTLGITFLSCSFSISLDRGEYGSVQVGKEVPGGYGMRVEPAGRARLSDGEDGWHGWMTCSAGQSVSS